MNDSSQDATSASPPVRSVLTRETLDDPFIEIHGWQYALSLLVEPDWRRMLGFGYFDKGSELIPGTVYDYRITGRFRRRELHERPLGFHTIPLGTALPAWFQLDSVLVETPEPAVVDMFPAATGEHATRCRHEGHRAYAARRGGPVSVGHFPRADAQAVFEFEPSAGQNCIFAPKPPTTLPL